VAEVVDHGAQLAGAASGSALVARVAEKKSVRGLFRVVRMG
jgi:hypothetical protein